MDLKLDIRNDTLIPSQAFKDWAGDVLTDEGIRTSGKNFFTKLGSRSKDLQKRLKELKQKIDACPAGSDAWFSKMFLWPFGGTVTADAKEYFEELEKDGQIKKLEDAADAAAAKRQENGRKLSAACAAALVLLDGESSLLAAVGELSVALTTTAPPEAAPVTADSLYTLFNTAIQADHETPAAVGGTTPAGPLTKAIGFANSAKEYVKSNPGGKPHLLAKIKAALDQTTVDPLISAILSGATPEVTVEQAKEALKSILARTDESRMFSSLDILLESGKITQEDYNRLSKRLSRTSVILNESPLPADAAELAKHKAEFGGFVSSIRANGEAIIAELKGLQLLGNKLSTVTESIHRKVMKAHIKKRLLQETASRDSREQLNEFFLFAALLAALTGALAWAASKVAEFFKGSEYGRGTATYSPRTPADRVDNGLQTLGASINAGYGPDGVLVGPDGKKVAGAVENKEATKVRMEDCVKNIISAMGLFFNTIQAGALAAAAAAAATPPVTPAVALATYLGVAATETDKVKAVEAALTKLKPYETDIIGPKKDLVKAALEAV